MNRRESLIAMLGTAGLLLAATSKAQESPSVPNPCGMYEPHHTIFLTDVPVSRGGDTVDFVYDADVPYGYHIRIKFNYLSPWLLLGIIDLNMIPETSRHNVLAAIGRRLHPYIGIVSPSRSGVYYITLARPLCD